MVQAAIQFLETPRSIRQRPGWLSKGVSVLRDVNRTKQIGGECCHQVAVVLILACTVHVIQRPLEHPGVTAVRGGEAPGD